MTPEFLVFANVFLFARLVALLKDQSPSRGLGGHQPAGTGGTGRLLSFLARLDWGRAYRHRCERRDLAPGRAPAAEP